MPTYFAECGLCKKIKSLRNSHLLPAAVYKLSRTPTIKKDPNPVLVTNKKALTSSKQVSTPFLCEDCEQRFSKYGETYVLAQCARPNSQFNLRELIKTASPLIDIPEGKVYNVQPLLGSNVGRYLYFAASVFWRASAHSWKIGNEIVGQISLDKQFQDQLRLYLLGETNFPQNARIFVHVSSEAQPDMITVFPCSTKVNGVSRYKFYILGLLFILFIDNDLSQILDEVALNGSHHQCMWLCPWHNDSLFHGSLELMKTSTPYGKICHS
jgi:hypothetical protein